MHPRARLALAVGLLGGLLPGCQSTSHDDVARTISRYLSGVFATPTASSTARPSPAASAQPGNNASRRSPIAEATPDLADPAHVAAALTVAQVAVHQPQASSTTMRDAAHRLQRADDALARHPDWVAQVVAAVPPEMHDAVQRDADAAVSLRTLNQESDGLPHWRVSDPPAAADLRRWYHQAQQESGVPWAYFAAINLVETHMGRIHADSSAGAQGPMQFMPDTWAQYGQGDVHDPRQAILAAGRFLQAAGGPDDMHKALYTYNPSDLYVQAVSDYAQRMLSDPTAFSVYYQWQAEAATTSGDVILPTGFSH